MRDGLEDGALQLEAFADSEILGVVQVRSAVARHELPEWQIGDILHGRQRGAGCAGESLLKCFGGGHGVIFALLGQPLSLPYALTVVPWCNGSTGVFGTSSWGSSPCGTTIFPFAAAA